MEQLDRCGYDGILAVGDLADRLHLQTLKVARTLGSLRTPLWVIPGNHDGTAPLDVLREAVGPPLNRRRRPERLARRMAQRLAELRAALHPHTLCGYSLHRVRREAHGDSPGLNTIDLIAARPHAMDSRHLTFAPYLEEAFGVADLHASRQRLRALVDAARHPLVFLAHNGPHGFGPDGPWGLRRPRRDNGDPDLTDAIAYARDRGKRVLAVVAGHMHLDRARPWKVPRDGALYLNAAKVPRWTRAGRHHIELHLTAAGARARWVTVGAQKGAA